MQIFRKLMILLLCFAFASQSVHAQSAWTQGVEEDECGDAYSQSSWTAHWSVYIPIALIVGAAIWFGVADSSSSTSFCSSSNDYRCRSSGDGLGSLGSSSRSYRSRSYPSKSYSPYSSLIRSTRNYHCHMQ